MQQTGLGLYFTNQSYIRKYNALVRKAQDLDKVSTPWNTQCLPKSNDLILVTSTISKLNPLLLEHLNRLVPKSLRNFTTTDTKYATMQQNFY